MSNAHIYFFIQNLLSYTNEKKATFYKKKYHNKTTEAKRDELYSLCIEINNCSGDGANL